MFCNSRNSSHICRSRSAKVRLAASAAVFVFAAAGGAAADDIMVTKSTPSSYSGAGYNWNGFYAGGHLGVAWGSSNWTASPGVSGSTSLFQTIDTFDEGGSFFAGVQGGYNYMLPNRILIGVEADASFPAWPTLPSGANPFGVSIGGSSAFHIALARPGELRRNGARIRHGARPYRLCAGTLAVLRDRRICLDLRSPVADADRDRRDRDAVPVAAGLGRRRGRRGADCAALDRATRISVHRLWPQRVRVFRRRRSLSVRIFRFNSSASA